MSVSLIFQLHIVFTRKLNTVLSKLSASLESGHQWRCTMHEVKETVLHIRCIQLLVNLFNTGNRNIVYVIKLHCIAIATVNGYAALAHGSKHPVFGLLTFCVFWDLMLLYAFMYEKAFAIIAEGLGRVKRGLRMRVRQCRTSRATKMVTMQLKSIPAVGIKVGNFHTLERVSTPVFVDYVICNIVDLLVTL